MSAQSNKNSTKPLARMTRDPLNRHRLPVGNKKKRRVSDLYRAHLASLGNPDDPTLTSLCLSAAELRAIAEDARARCLSGSSAIQPDTVVKLDGCAARAEKRLEKYRVKDGHKTNGKVPTPLEYANGGAGA